jgi:hypothetical protein
VPAWSMMSLATRKPSSSRRRRSSRASSARRAALASARASPSPSQPAIRLDLGVAAAEPPGESVDQAAARERKPGRQDAARDARPDHAAGEPRAHRPREPERPAAARDQLAGALDEEAPHGGSHASDAHATVHELASAPEIARARSVAALVDLAGSP